MIRRSSVAAAAALIFLARAARGAASRRDATDADAPKSTTTDRHAFLGEPTCRRRLRTDDRRRFGGGSSVGLAHLVGVLIVVDHRNATTPLTRHLWQHHRRPAGDSTTSPIGAAEAVCGALVASTSSSSANDADVVHVITEQHQCGLAST
jgi:hypothetical protein